VLRRVAAGAPEWLAPGGHLLSEVSERQVAAGTRAVTRVGLTARVDRSEEHGATVLIASRPSPHA
jgi:release factor glutamine methyltransferase